MTAVFEPRMLLWLRCRVPLGAAFESPCVEGVRRGGGASWAECVVIARGMQESFTLIQRLGYALDPSAEKVLSRSPSWAPAGIMVYNSPEVFRELLATGIKNGALWRIHWWRVHHERFRSWSPRRLLRSG